MVEILCTLGERGVKAAFSATERRTQDASSAQFDAERTGGQAERILVFLRLVTEVTHRRLHV